MTNVERVKAVISRLPARFTLDDVETAVNAAGEPLTRSQVSKAVRSLPMVSSVTAKQYRVRGRKV